MTELLGGSWPGVGGADLRDERHYGDRVFPCYAQRPRNLGALLRAQIAERGAHDAVIAGGRRLSYEALDRLAGHAAAQLAAHGIGPGDRVAFLLCNCVEFAVALLAAIRVGAIAVPLGARLKAPELDYALNDCGAAALVTEREYAGNLPPVSALPTLRFRVLVDGAASGYVAGEEFLSPAPPPPWHEPGEDETAVILYTSGTTGRPKGAMLTHLGIIHSARNFALCAGLGPGDRAVLTVPASHVTGLVAILFTMLGSGGATVMMRAFKARDFLELMAVERGTFTVMVPAQYNLCLLQPDLASFDLSAWRVGTFGGAPMPEATIAALARHLPNLVLVNAYGATETTSPTTIMPPGLNTAHPDSVGRIVPGGHVRIVDDGGRDLSPGETGEIWIKGAMVVPGYWNRPDANAAEFTDGYWHSGDIGSLDGAGFLRVFDRKKDMINRAGYKIFSAEVENVLGHHPDIVESAIVGVPDPVLGERVKAFVLPRHGGLTAEAVRAFCAERLADYKVPEFVVLVGEPLPRNANGKLQKAVLRGKPLAE
jgi:acyl-CoA synthetase (AMP-forming)/AMP-acid ligase II